MKDEEKRLMTKEQETQLNPIRETNTTKLNKRKANRMKKANNEKKKLRLQHE